MNNTNQSSICIFSYNSRGSSREKLCFINSLIKASGSDIPIFCIQEHFTMRNNLYKFSKTFVNFSVFSVPAVKDFEAQDRGRPKGGLSIILPKEFRKSIKLLNCEYWRIQSIMLNINNVKYLIINTYFPVDSRKDNDDCEELEKCLSQIRSILNINSFDHLLFVGDQNCDPSRNTNHVKLINDLLEESQLYDLWTDYEVDFTYSFDNKNGDSTHKILDHIYTLKRSKPIIIDAGVLHLSENMSDHEVTFAKIKVALEEQKHDDNPQLEAPKLNWKAASEDQKLDYNDALFRKLNTMEVPESIVSCRNVNCNDQNHKLEIDEYVHNLMTHISDSGHETIPIKESKPIKNKATKNIAGWKDFVEPFQQKARFWHAVWLSAGKPVNTELHRIMKTTRNTFHYQIRRCRRVEDFIKNQKIIENCIETDEELFGEIKKQRRAGLDDNVTIDGASGKAIPNEFANVYKELFNRENDEAEVDSILNKINMGLSEDSVSDLDKINIVTIKEALEKIKPNKSDPTWDFSSDFLKQGPDTLLKHLEIMIKSFLIHGHVSSSLLLATLVPIIKDKLGDLCSSKNYRSIALSSVILKLIDWLIINIFGHLLQLDDFQFGFQQNSSTALCSWVVYETIDSYLRNGSTVYGVLMDCTKAFDTVQHSKLFQKLVDAGLPSIIIRLLISIYQNQEANVRWRSGVSDNFKIKNGVRQGAILSPIIFCFYMNDLFGELRRSRSGCFLGSFYAGVHGYADDLLLLCPSRSGLQEMVNISEKYATEHKIQFSTHPEAKKSKTKGIVFSNKKLNFEPAPVELCGNPLPWVTSAKYLGGKITSVLDGYQQDARCKRAQFIERNCELLQEFHLAHPNVKSRINTIYNSAFSGSVLWDFKGESTNKLINSWSVAVRHMWDLPFNSHRYFMEPFGGTHAKTMLICRYIKFIQNLRKSTKPGVIFLLQKVMTNVNTITGSNIRYVLEETGYDDIFEIRVGEVKKNFKFCDTEEMDKWKVDFAREIVDIKHNALELDQNLMTKEELNEILAYLTTC